MLLCIYNAALVGLLLYYTTQRNIAYIKKQVTVR